MKKWIWPILLAVLFAVLGGLIHTEGLRSIDRAIGDFFFGLRNDSLTPLVKGISELGTTTGFVVVLLITLIWTLVFLRNGRYAVWLTISLIGGWLLNKLLKALYTRERPDLWESLVVPDGYSFPSGNAMISAALFGLIALLLFRSGKAGNRVWAAIVLLILLLIGVSRLYLGVHYASDIVGGLLAGAAIAEICSWGAVRRSNQ
ncbi:phosphatidylglycerophosphatase B [Paenibacillus antibioticophila]|uniref:Phosphatidylglycerophosphatase B n=1 Tax=Paenibacillus antibioticophila TaxID=1274374 RepID=A0A920CIA4_9BACL|nr:phosphatase PAP2 family protein [Paenibacillus antibioticophila]GIO38094.1 phosphatidylglycerophosphatase B [Paenibacillus antibioticophila]